MKEIIDILEDYILRWRKHSLIIEELQKTNINKDELKIWENQINAYFKKNIKASL